MMKKFSSLLLVCICIGYHVHAQEGDKLNVPVSPAFSILGFEPSAVMRPTSAKSLATDVLTSFDKNGKLLMNLGLEVSPYWLKSHPTLTRHKYLYPSLGQSVLQSLSISAGTAKDSASGANKLGAGFRFRLANGKPVAALEAAEREMTNKDAISLALATVRGNIENTSTKKSLLDIIAAKLKNESKLDDAVVSSIINRANAISTNFGNSPDDLANFIDSVINDRDNAETDLKKKISDLVYDRRGFITEFAGATGYQSDKKRFDKLGFWANASYYISADNFFTLTARYIHQGNDTTVNNVDVGLGFLTKGTSYNISIEAMLRWYQAELPALNANNQPITRLDKSFTYRLAVQGSYTLTKDISVNVSIGKDFDSPFISSKGVFSILGINYSLFSKEPPKLN